MSDTESDYEFDPADFLFFYNEKSAHGYLSQFHRSQFVDGEGNQYFCCEQYMMVNKARLFLEDFPDNGRIIERMLRSNSPKEIKGLGRQVRGFNNRTWNRAKYDIVLQGNMYKFFQNEQLKERLLSTGDLVLVEAAANDRIWGVGYSVREAPTVDMSQWGKNLLGQILMEVRTALAE